MYKLLSNKVIKIEALDSRKIPWHGPIEKRVDLVEKDTRLIEELFLQIESRVMITWNICSEIGLSNGSTGIVKDIIYKQGESPIKHRPFCILIQIS